MRRHGDHLTSDELLSFIDGELPPRRAVYATAHLDACAACRGRRAHIDRVMGLVGRGYRKDVAMGDMAATRQAVHVALTERRQQLERSWSTFRDAMRALTPAWVLIAAVAAVGLVAVERRTPLTGSFETLALASAATGELPIASLTPGDTLPLSAAELCAHPRERRQHRLPASVRYDVLRNYRMEHLSPAEYELDFLITPELGGSAERTNLWPERYRQPVWNARVKDELEELLPRLVCTGRLSLDVAQRDIATDWIAAYQKYFNTNSPLKADAVRFPTDLDEIIFDEPGVPTLALALLPPGSAEPHDTRH